MSKKIIEMLSDIHSIIAFIKHLGVAFKFDVEINLIRFRGGELVNI